MKGDFQSIFYETPYKRLLRGPKPIVVVGPPTVCHRPWLMVSFHPNTIFR